MHIKPDGLLRRPEVDPPYVLFAVDRNPSHLLLCCR